MSEFTSSEAFDVFFHDRPGAQTVSGGEVKFDDLVFYEFPGVSVCIPIVITNADESRIIAAIHANDLWDPDRLNETVLSLKSNGASKITYAERVPPIQIQTEDSFQYVPVENESRQAILTWLQNNQSGVTVTRTPITAQGLIDHIGYKKRVGFRRLNILPKDRK